MKPRDVSLLYDSADQTGVIFLSQILHLLLEKHKYDHKMKKQTIVSLPQANNRLTLLFISDT